MSFTWFADRPLMTREQIAAAVHGVSLARGLDKLATVIALMTISTEVGTGNGDDRKWWCPANNRIPASLGYRHDSLSDDNRSMGYFQQQPGPSGEPWWGATQDMMTLETATNTFLTRLADDYTKASNSASLAGQYAQRVQQSAYPDRYAEKWDEAWQVLDRALGGVSVTPTPSDVVVLKPGYNEYANWTTNFSPRRGVKPDLFLIHSQEAGGGDNAADDLSKFLRSTEGTGNPVSYHYVISQASDGGITVVDCVDTDYAAWSVGNSNARSINLCFAGSRVAWTRGQWLQQSKAIDVAAYLAVQDCKKYSIDTRVIPSPYVFDPPGISDHRYCTQRLKDGNTHTDVGDQFPWDVFKAAVDKYAGKATPTPPIIKPPPSLTDTQLLQEVWDQLLGPNARGWAQLGNRTLVDAVAAIGAELGMDGFNPPEIKP